MDHPRVDKEKFLQKRAGSPGESWSQRGNSPSLKKKSLFFFSLTIVLTLVTIGAMLYEAKVDRGAGGVSPLFLAASLLLLCSLIGGMIFFQRNILAPLEKIESSVQRMADGRLDRSISLQSGDEIGQVGERINDLAINMQEVLLFIWNHTQQNFTLLDTIAEQLDEQRDKAVRPSRIEETVAQVRQGNEELAEVITTFSYFEVKLEHEKMVSDPPQESMNSKS